MFAVDPIVPGELLAAELPTLLCPEPRAGETRHVAAARHLLAAKMHISTSTEVRACAAGGGRGVFAVAPIVPGELLAAELPTLLCPEPRAGETRHVAAARHLLALPRAATLAGEWRIEDAGAASLLELLHPRALDELAIHPVRAPREQFAREVAYLRRQPRADDGAPERSADEVLRVLLQVRLNAFDSGIYQHLSMFNHACHPNAIKFGTAHDRLGRSRVAALRRIEVGEEVTIHYLHERLLSHESRRQALLEQHFFALGPSPFAPPLELAPLHPSARATSGPAGGAFGGADAPACEVAAAAAADAPDVAAHALLALLEAALNQIEADLEGQSGSHRNGCDAAGAALPSAAAPNATAPGRLATASAALQALLRHDRLDARLDGHLAVGRCWQLLARVESARLAEPPSAEGAAEAAAERAHGASLVLRACVQLDRNVYRRLFAEGGALPAAGAALAPAAARRSLVLGEARDHALGAHYELAANALAYLLANEPQALLRDFGELWPTRGRAAQEQHALLEAARAVCRLYADRDVERVEAAAPSTGETHSLGAAAPQFAVPSPACATPLCATSTTGWECFD